MRILFIIALLTLPFLIAVWIERFRTRQPTIPTNRDSGSPQQRATCSFCGKDQDQVRKIIAGPAVFICDECTDLCNDIIAEEYDTGEARPPQAALPSGSPVPGLACVLCRLPKDTAELLMVSDRGLICTVCVDAIRAAVEQREKHDSSTT